jgi:hydrogenase-4 component E
VAAQGALIGCIPVIKYFPCVAPVTVIFPLTNIILKGVVFPWLLLRALRAANIRKEVEPIGGYPFSLLMGVAIFVLSYWVISRVSGPGQPASVLNAAVSFATFFTGAYIIVSRMKAITQVIGYLMLENGIYLFGLVYLKEQSLLVEMSILLDIFVAVFVMGIAIFHISREFDHIDTEKLSQLKDIMATGQDL